MINGASAEEGQLYQLLDLHMVEHRVNLGIGELLVLRHLQSQPVGSKQARSVLPVSEHLGINVEHLRHCLPLEGRHNRQQRPAQSQPVIQQYIEDAVEQRIIETFVRPRQLLQAVLPRNLQRLLDGIEVDIVVVLNILRFTVMVICTASGSYWKFPSEPGEWTTFPTPVKAPPLMRTLLRILNVWVRWKARATLVSGPRVMMHSY